MNFIVIITGNGPEATQTRIKEEYMDLFQHSAVSSFFAYLPIYFWKVVVDKTNERLREKKLKDMDIDEMMKFLGILFYMSLVDKGKNIRVLSRLRSHLNCLGGYEEYWGIQVDDIVLNNITSGNSYTPCMDDIMDLKRLALRCFFYYYFFNKTNILYDRFKAIRANLAFREITLTPDQLKKDPAARIRPLISMLKKTSPQYVDIGRNVSIDESTVACRSKYGRKLIVFNPRKPTGTMISM